VASHYIATYDALGDTYTHMAMIEALPNGTLLAVWQVQARVPLALTARVGITSRATVERWAAS